MPVGLVSPLPTNYERTNTTTVPSSPAFDVLRLLKTTPTSKICLVLPRATFIPVVLKTSNTSASNSVLNELRILQKLSHPAIINPLNAPLRYGDDGTYNDKLNAPIECHLFLPYLQPLPAQSTKPHHFMSILEALSHVHSHGYVHADVKPTNILASYPVTNPKKGEQEFKLVLTDFSHSRPVGHSSKVLYTTTGFSLPSYSGTYTPEIDYYALKTTLNHLFKSSITSHSTRSLSEFLLQNSYSNPYPSTPVHPVQKYVTSNLNLRKSLASLKTSVQPYSPPSFSLLPLGTFHSGGFTLKITPTYIFIFNPKMFLFSHSSKYLQGSMKNGYIKSKSKHSIVKRLIKSSDASTTVDFNLKSCPVTFEDDILNSFFGLNISSGSTEGSGWATSERLRIHLNDNLVEYGPEGCTLNGNDAGGKWWDFSMKVCERILEDKITQVQEERRERNEGKEETTINLDVTVDSFLFESEDDETVSSLGDLVDGVEDVEEQQDQIDVDYENKKVIVNDEVYEIVKGRAVGEGGEEGKAIRAWVEEMRRRRTVDRDDDSDVQF
ncbi:hypothetical protein TrVE_jg3642 [Triparma verrucosa]|uniref:Protein kinase domain-containing protein n=1 Tax=Triparma verrucosa TaxID=1606542 RepID=A0A9W7BKL9_9STRA|nr:hypothetical protein TrVE_jg3642 [Triparma verrucosa]